MLEADEIDEDYFTPTPSTSLANIFGGPLHKGQEAENESLKYTPPKQHLPQVQDISTSPTVEPRTENSNITECIFACALTAYEWTDIKYILRGPLGFAILKIKKNNSYCIILYDFKKLTISKASITPKLNITKKGNNYLSYYDNLNKYWSIYGKDVEINKIIEILKSIGIDVQHSLDTDQNLPEPNKADKEDKTHMIVHDKESDTDSSINRRTKASILNRMASMGHSVLPVTIPPVDTTSDSSDSNEIVAQPPRLRPKPTKAPVKRNNTEKKGLESEISESINLPESMIDLSSVNPVLCSMVNGQLVPVSIKNLITPNSNSNELAFFITEQRMNSTELRLNVSRTTDKIDQVLEKLKHLENTNCDGGSNFQMEIMQKLLKEYECKIKNYEKLLALRSSGDDIGNKHKQKLDQPLEIEYFKTQISNLQNLIKEKDEEIKKIKDENFDDELVKEIASLKESLALKTELLEKVTNKLHESYGKDINFENKLKDLMNDVFSSISEHFENDESYSGNSIKKIIATIIKKATIQSLGEHNSKK